MPSDIKPPRRVKNFAWGSIPGTRVEVNKIKAYSFKKITVKIGKTYKVGIISQLCRHTNHPLSRRLKVIRNILQCNVASSNSITSKQTEKILGTHLRTGLMTKAVYADGMDANVITWTSILSLHLTCQEC